MKSLYEFTKILSVLFLLSAIGFIFSQMYLLAAIGFGSFLIIRLIDSDWMFNIIPLDNTNSIIVTITFVALCIYGFFIYEEMQYAPMLTKVTPEHQTAYLAFENEMSNIFKNCEKAHNELIDKLDYGTDISKKEQEETNKICSNSFSKIEDAQLQNDFPKSLKTRALKNKSDYKKIAINLSSYQYSEKISQNFLNERIKKSIQNIDKNTKKIRLSMNIDNQKNTFIPLSLKFQEN